MKRLIARFVLRPLVKENYQLRYGGRLPDQWYWADALMCQWGCWDLLPGTDELKPKRNQKNSVETT